MTEQSEHTQHLSVKFTVLYTGAVCGTPKTMTIVMSKITEGDFPDGPVAKTLHSQCIGPGFNPWSGTRSHARTKDPASGK